MANCESEIIKLTGIVDENNINTNYHQFWMYDTENKKYSISIKVKKNEQNINSFRKNNKDYW